MTARVFVDTSYIIARFLQHNAHHALAMALAQHMVAVRTQLITTRAVLAEVGDAFAKRPTRAAGIHILDTLESDPALQIIPASDALYHRARALYGARADQEWGFTDCIAFVVMQTLGITEALTADRHFTQAGFRALLRHDS